MYTATTNVSSATLFKTCFARLLLLVIAFLAAANVAKKAHAQVDADIMGALPTVSDIAISPNGETIAYVYHDGAETILFISQTNNPDATPKGINLGDVKSRDIRWADDNYLLLLISVADIKTQRRGKRPSNFSDGCQFPKKIFMWNNFSAMQGLSIYQMPVALFLYYRTRKIGHCLQEPPPM